MGQAPPKSVRLGEERAARVLAWATDMALSEHAAILALIDRGLAPGVLSAGMLADLAEIRSKHPHPDYDSDEGVVVALVKGHRKRCVACGTGEG